MKYIKLFFISVFVFGLMLFCISLLFPKDTIVSRAVNVGGSKDSLLAKLPQVYLLAFNDSENANKTIRRVDSLQKIEDLKNASNNSVSPLDSTDFSSMSNVRAQGATVEITTGDTLAFTSPFAANIQQGAAVYQTASDSTVIQVFYKIHVPVYKFWDKFGLMLNEVKYGPSLDSAISRIKKKF